MTSFEPLLWLIAVLSLAGLVVALAITFLCYLIYRQVAMRSAVNSASEMPMRILKAEALAQLDGAIREGMQVDASRAAVADAYLLEVQALVH